MAYTKGLAIELGKENNRSYTYKYRNVKSDWVRATRSQLLFSSYLIHLLSSHAERGGGSPAAERLKEKQPSVLAWRGFHPSGTSSVFLLIYQICNGQAFISLRDWAKTQGQQD